MDRVSLPFSVDNQEDFGAGSYKPEPPHPSGLRNAWSLFSLVFIIGAGLMLTGFHLPRLFWVTQIILLLVAVAVSFSHYVEKNTSISLDEEKISYRSPLRNVDLAYQQVQELRCVDLGGGYRFFIAGRSGAFRFQSLMLFRSGSGREVRSGYAHALKIAQFIQQRAGLVVGEQRDEVWFFRRPG